MEEHGMVNLERWISCAERFSAEKVNLNTNWANIYRRWPLPPAPAAIKLNLFHLKIDNKLTCFDKLKYRRFNNEWICDNHQVSKKNNFESEIGKKMNDIWIPVFFVCAVDWIWHHLCKRHLPFYCCGKWLPRRGSCWRWVNSVSRRLDFWNFIKMVFISRGIKYKWQSTGKTWLHKSTWTLYRIWYLMFQIYSYFF